MVGKDKISQPSSVMVVARDHVAMVMMVLIVLGGLMSTSFFLCSRKQTLDHVRMLNAS